MGFIEKASLLFFIVILSLFSNNIAFAEQLNSVTYNGEYYHLNMTDGWLYYPLDVNSTSQIYDHSHKNYTGDIGGNPTFNQNCNWGGCYRFGDVLNDPLDEDHIYIPNLTNNQLFNGSFSVSAWVKLDNWNQQISLISGNWLDGAHFNPGWYLAINNVNKTIFKLRGSSSSVGLSQSNFLNLNEWYHIVAIYNRSNEQMRLYVDLLSMGTASAPTNSGFTSTRVFRIGDYGEPTATPTVFNGSIDDVMLFNRALTEAEIFFLYQGWFEKYQPSGNIIFPNINAFSSVNDNGVMVQINPQIDFEGTYITVQIGVPNGSGYSYSEEYTPVGGVVAHIPVEDTSNVSLKINMYADEYQFYSPILYPDFEVTGQSIGIDIFDYDGNGNLIQDDQYYYEYNDFNQLVRIREVNASGNIIEEYIYKPGGSRIQKISFSDTSNITSTYIGNHFVEERNGSSTTNFTYYEHNGEIVAEKSSSGETLFYHNDALGNPDVITDENGDVVGRIVQKPYGLRLDENPARYSFGGKEQGGSGHYYFEARYFSPDLRLFTQPDPITVHPYVPQSLQQYGYGLNNPFVFEDESGEYVETLLDIGFIALDIAAIVQDPSDWVNYVALGADVIGLALPFVTGGGALVVGGIKLADKIQDVEKISDLTLSQQKAIRTIENIKLKNLDPKTLDAVIREVQGEIVKLKSSGKPYDHIAKAIGARAGLQTAINSLEGSLKNPNLSKAQREIIERKLQEANDLAKLTDDALRGVRSE